MLLHVKLLLSFVKYTVIARFYISMVYSKERLQLSLTYQTEESVLLVIRNYSFLIFFQVMETQVSVMGDSQVEATAEVSSNLPVKF